MKKERVPKFLQAMRARQNQSTISTTESVLTPAQANLHDEVENICRLASEGECRVIGFNQLVFFSTQTRDVWVLDWEDELAICLMKDGLRQPCEFGETDRQFAIRWRGRYHLEGGLFSYIDNKTPTHAQIIGGYPTDVIRNTIERLREGI
ncbi:MAG: hypothetical protein HY735_23360 [Verrucomicrobia bacterium]|nr:hypothetical protein [Verrucomicrobiota bacterium]